MFAERNKQMNALKLIAIWFFMFNYGHSQILSGVITRVKDGDTVVAQVGTKSITIRLAKIDAPEKRQIYGMIAKKSLEDLVLDRNVSINIETIDKYQRSVAVLSYSGITYNYLMVLQGNAWHYAKYDKSKEYIEAEELARKEKRGLWKSVTKV